ncbi:MAG: hypothetical protein JWO05_3263 [Gemmatimonadetes bacterium]|nr:hypothetical protein [Gemmatimonadota bacterium]
MHLIDVGTVLRQAVSATLYSNLVTRPTGAAVRQQIEELVTARGDRALTVIDFSQVSMIDFSCADEIVAKLLLRYQAEEEIFFVFRGVTEDHLHAIDAVLEHRGLALVAEEDGESRVVGVLEDSERRAWEALYLLGRATTLELAAKLTLDLTITQLALDALWRRRLVMRADEFYFVAAAPRAGSHAGSHA